MYPVSHMFSYVPLGQPGSPPVTVEDQIESKCSPLHVPCESYVPLGQPGSPPLTVMLRVIRLRVSVHFVYPVSHIFHYTNSRTTRKPACHRIRVIREILGTRGTKGTGGTRGGEPKEPEESEEPGESEESEESKEQGESKQPEEPKEPEEPNES